MTHSLSHASASGIYVARYLEQEYFSKLNMSTALFCCHSDGGKGLFVVRKSLYHKYKNINTYKTMHNVHEY